MKSPKAYVNVGYKLGMMSMLNVHLAWIRHLGWLIGRRAVRIVLIVNTVMACCVFLLSFGAAFADGSAPAENLAGSSMIRGICVHIPRYKMSAADVLQRLQELGATSFREGLPWGSVEKKRGEYRIPKRERELDVAFKTAKGYGITPLLILGYGNKLYEPGGLVTTKKARDGFVKYATWVAKRYKGDVRYFEVWNEWHNGFGSTTHPKTIGSVSDYAKLIEEVSKAVKKVIPNAVIIAGSANSNTEWYRKLAATGVLKFIDGVSIHPYNYGRSWKKSRPQDAIAGVESVHAIVSAAAGRDLPMYITEMGWPTHKNGYADAAAAAYLSRLFMLARVEGNIRGVWWYDLRDDGRNARNKEHRFGLLTFQWQRKSAAEAFHTIGSFLSSHEIVRFTRSQKFIHISFKDANNIRSNIAWSTGPAKRHRASVSNLEPLKLRGTNSVGIDSGIIKWRGEASQGRALAEHSIVPVIYGASASSTGLSK